MWKKLLDEKNPLHNWTLHISGTFTEMEKANIEVKKVNIETGKVNIEELVTAKTTGYVQKL